MVDGRPRPVPLYERAAEPYGPVDPDGLIARASGTWEMYALVAGLPTESRGRCAYWARHALPIASGDQAGLITADVIEEAELVIRRASRCGVADLWTVFREFLAAAGYTLG
jgi:hypothetical protein